MQLGRKSFAIGLFFFLKLIKVFVSSAKSFDGFFFLLSQRSIYIRLQIEKTVAELQSMKIEEKCIFDSIIIND